VKSFEETVISRLQLLEREVERLRVKERPDGGGVTDHGALTGLADNDHPQYRLVADAIDHGALSGLADNDHPQYLLTSGKAADADKLDNIDSTGFVQTTGNQSVGGIKTFTSIPVLPATNPTTANQAVRKGFADATYLGITAKAADADKLNGQLASYYALATHNHNGVYIPLTNFAGSNAAIVGWTGTPAKQITYVVVGKILLMSVYIQGTSNATTTRIDLPTGITGATHGISQLHPCRVVNNGTLATSPGIAILPNAGTYIDFYTNYAGAAWTATGTKQVSGNFAWLID